MAKPLRIEYEGALCHVLSRGNAGEYIFKDAKDRLTFLDIIGDACQRFGLDVFAYVLMDNHYHLLLRTNRANLSKAMQM
ncbi:MAG: transposase [Deltaproteobacteria bacterium]|nr:transposase [Deltaproteobacteria bacterium]MBW1993295.1 transposase [Deltaproteobacteria bacterium]